MSSTPLLIDEPPLQVLPTLAQAIGLNEAIVLQQVHYWLNPRFNKNFFGERYWVRNTYAQWRQQFPFFSERTLRRTIGNLEASGLLVSCMGGHLKQIKFYTINYSLLKQTDLVNLHKMVRERSRKGPGSENPCQEIHGPEIQTQETQGPKIQEPLENGAINPSGQIGHLTWPNWPDSERENFLENSPKMMENQVIRSTWPDWPSHLAEMTTPPGQNDQPLWPDWPPSQAKMATPPGQIGHLSYSKNTIREYPENTLPPLPPVLQGSVREESEEEEEEEENKNLNSENTKSDLFNSLIQIWNETVQSKIHPGKEVYLTKDREKLLTHFLGTVLTGRKGFWPSGNTDAYETEAWRNYCTLIARSRFLAGENPNGFKVSLDWALIPEKAYKILEGVIYDKPSKPALNDTPQNPSWEELEAKLRQNILQRHACQELHGTEGGQGLGEQWVAICKNLAPTLGHAVFKSWFLTTTLIELTSETATIQAETLFMRDYIDSRFRLDVTRSIQALHPTVTQIKFLVASHVDGKRSNTLSTQEICHD